MSRFRTHDRTRRINTSGHLFVGVVIMVIGFLFLLDTLNVADTSRIISRGWPLIFVAIGVTRLIQTDTPEGRLGGAAWIFVGSIFFLSRMGYLPFSVWGLIWPVALISFGFYLVMRSRYGMNVPEDSTAKINAMAILGGVERKVTAQDFEGGELTAMLGGCVIDLRDASLMDSEATVEIFILAGGMEIFVPESWTIISKVVPIMGGYEDRTHGSKDPAKRLIVRGLVLMGGIEVKNN
jgi:predicted membrane protein